MQSQPGKALDVLPECEMAKTIGQQLPQNKSYCSNESESISSWLRSSLLDSFKMVTSGLFPEVIVIMQPYFI